jgi:ribonuclease HII
LRASLLQLLQCQRDGESLTPALEKLAARERDRVEALWAHEIEHWTFSSGASQIWIVGVDEVGRGPLAGPLMAAAAAFRCPMILPGINDSKKLTEPEREVLSQILTARVEHFSVATITPEEIGRGNLHKLSLKALRDAVTSLPIEPDLVMVDGKYPIPHLACPQKTVIGGDRTCASIAVASIIAKVARDLVMNQLDQQFPGYGLAKHKGYGTQEHRDALERLGPSLTHRPNFGPVKAVIQRQMELFG